MSLDIAVALARVNSVIGLPRMAAVIMDGHRVVSWGHNSRLTHPLQEQFGRNHQAICLHAEIAALAAAKENMRGCTMYVARVYRNAEPALARPCAGCERALAAFRIADVQWTA